MERDYLGFFESDVDFMGIGFADGYNDLEKDDQELVRQLINKLRDKTLSKVLSKYRMGYSCGRIMGEQKVTTSNIRDINYHENVNPISKPYIKVKEHKRG